MTFAKIRNFVIIIVIIFLLIESKSKKPLFISMPVFNVKNIFSVYRLIGFGMPACWLMKIALFPKKKFTFRNAHFIFSGYENSFGFNLPHIDTKRFISGKYKPIFWWKTRCLFKTERKKKSHVNYLNNFKKRDWQIITGLIFDWIYQIFLCFKKLINRKKNAIHHVFNIYNRFFYHIETETRRLKRKGVSWKIIFFKTLDAFNEKLFHYYNQTQSGLGHFYGLTIFLRPNHGDST